MCVNVAKSSFAGFCEDLSVSAYIAELFPCVKKNLDEGNLYLGFKINPNSYAVADWKWLILKVSRMINSWASRWLTLEGRLILL